MNLTSFVIATFAVYRATRLVVVDNIGDPIRDPLLGWLRKGESAGARVIGNVMLGLAAVAAVLAGVLRLTGFIDNSRLAQSLLGCLVAFAAGAVVGHRDYVEELIGCRWCVGVWVSAGVGASLSLWGHWPIVPTGVFILGVAGAAAFLALTEDWIETVTERAEHDSWMSVSRGDVSVTLGRGGVADDPNPGPH